MTKRIKLSSEYKKAEDFLPGDTLSYPCDDLRFFYVAEVSEIVVKAIVNTLNVMDNLINKVGVVISVEIERTIPRVTAVYQHDGRYWIIQRRWEE